MWLKSTKDTAFPARAPSNLRLAALYGLYGTEQSGGFADMPMPPMEDLSAAQAAAAPSIPLHFFLPEQSAVGALSAPEPARAAMMAAQRRSAEGLEGLV